MILSTSLQGFSSSRFPKVILTLGAFDGVHIGHQKVLRRVSNEAKKIGGTATLLTFQEHPQKVLKPHQTTSMLTSFQHKLSLIQQEDMDLCLALHFTREFSMLSPEAFVKRILLDKLKVRKVILGHDSRFGHHREGDTHTMAALAKKYGFAFSVIPPVQKGNFTVSSTLIRRLIAEGDLQSIRRFLGRTYSIMATVVRGTGRGRKLGFPTANLNPHSELLPPAGVYVVRVCLTHLKPIRRSKGSISIGGPGRRRFFPAVMNLGVRPTFEVDRAGGIIPEVYIMGFSGQLYGRMVEVEFLKKLRNEIKFADPLDLRQQISRDVADAKRFFSTFTSQ